jgi:uncharacterized membrane protein
MTWSQRLLALAFTAAGTLHFVRPRMYEEIMPGYLPAHHELVLASGAAEIAGALALLNPRSRRLGGLCLAAVLAAVFPANVHMALHPGRYPGFAAALLWARLPIQPLLIWWALRATIPPTAPREGES